MFANSKAYCPHRNCNKCPTQRRFCSSSTFFCLCTNLELGVRDNWWFPHIQSFQPKQAEIWRCDVKAHRLERLPPPRRPPPGPDNVYGGTWAGASDKEKFPHFSPTHNHNLTKLTHSKPLLDQTHPLINHYLTSDYVFILIITYQKNKAWQFAICCLFQFILSGVHLVHFDSSVFCIIHIASSASLSKSSANPHHYPTHLEKFSITFFFVKKSFAKLLFSLFLA